MRTLIGLSKSNIVALLLENITLFEKFEKVYFFGSVLDENKVPNDIDLLLIYTSYSDVIQQEINRILVSLESIIGLPVDLTTLSIEEERDTQFLSRISRQCLKLK